MTYLALIKKGTDGPPWGILRVDQTHGLVIELATPQHPEFTSMPSMARFLVEDDDISYTATLSDAQANQFIAAWGVQSIAQKYDESEQRDSNGKWTVGDYILGSDIKAGNSEYAKNAGIAYPKADGVVVPKLEKNQVYLVRYSTVNETKSSEGVGYFAYAGKNIDDVVNSTQSYAFGNGNNGNVNEGFLTIGRTEEKYWEDYHDRADESAGVELNGILGTDEAPVDLVINLKTGEMLYPTKKYDESEQRDDHGKWSSSGLTAGVDRENWPEHIKSLVIPLAWKDVRFSEDPNAALLVTGKDSKGRTQYVYSKAFQDSQAAIKFERITQLQNQLPAIDRQLTDIRKNGNEIDKEHAECAWLVRWTGIRPGSDEDTGAEKKAYGATTLTGSHVVVNGNQVSLQFVGKKGVDLNIPVANMNIARRLVQIKQDVGDGPLFPHVTDASLRDFVHERLDHGDFKTKDFRTLLGTTTAISMVNKTPAPSDKKSYVKAVKGVGIYWSDFEIVCK